MSWEFDIDEWEFDRTHLMQFLPLKSTFFPLVINRLKTLEIISVIPCPSQVFARASVQWMQQHQGGSAQVLGGHHTPCAPAMLAGTARNSAVHLELGFMWFKDKTKNKQQYYTLIIQQLSPTTAGYLLKSI